MDKKGYLIRSKSDIAFIEYYGFNKYKESYNRFKICEIDYINDNFYLKVEYQNDEVTYDIDDKVYILTNSINGLKINENDYYGYELNEGDIIKIGRFKVKVRKIHLVEKKINNDDDGNQSEKEDKKSSNNNDISYNDDIRSKDSNCKSIDKMNINNNNNNNKNNEEERQCRICFLNDESISPLISPCSCTGSSKYIHLLCLQKWLQSKIKLDYKEKNENLISAYRYQRAQCEICKEYMPDFIKKNSNLYEICDYHRTSEGNDESYFTLETIGSVKNHEKYIYHVIIKSERPISTISIGRSNECDIKLEDSTISRIHSFITIFNNKMYIKDMSSKFGTGILMQNKNFQILDDSAISFQLGRSLITFYQTPKNNSICKCFNKKKKEINNNVNNDEFYFNENKKCINYEMGYIIKEND